MYKYIIIFLLFANVSFLSSCKTGSCACPVTYEDTKSVLEPIEKDIKNVQTSYDKFAIEHKIF